MAEDERRLSRTSERRQHPRYPLSVNGTAWTLSRLATGPFAVATNNISLGGLMLHTTAGAASLLQIGDRLLLVFPDPTGSQRLTYKATVTWIRHGLANLLGSWAFGVRFHETKEEDIRILHDPAARTEEPLPET